MKTKRPVLVLFVFVFSYSCIQVTARAEQSPLPVESILADMEASRVEAAKELRVDVDNVEVVPKVFHPIGTFCLSDEAYQAAKKDKNAAIFDVGKSIPNKEGNRFIQTMIKDLVPGATLKVIGYTDSIPKSGSFFGSLEDISYQEKLSLERARNVKNLSEKAGLKVLLVEGHGRGLAGESPAVPFSPDHRGEAANRRIVVKVLDLPGCNPKEVRIWVSTSYGYQNPAPRGIQIIVKLAEQRFLIACTGTGYKPAQENELELIPYFESCYVDFPTVNESVEIVGWKLPGKKTDWIFPDNPIYGCSRSPEGTGANLLDLSAASIVPDAGCK